MQTIQTSCLQWISAQTRKTYYNYTCNPFITQIVSNQPIEPAPATGQINALLVDKQLKEKKSQCSQRIKSFA